MHPSSRPPFLSHRVGELLLCTDEPPVQSPQTHTRGVTGTLTHRNTKWRVNKLHSSWQNQGSSQECLFRSRSSWNVKNTPFLCYLFVVYMFLFYYRYFILLSVTSVGPIWIVPWFSHLLSPRFDLSCREFPSLYFRLHVSYSSSIFCS